MNESHSDALVFFGATGDLAYKKIFPALQAMVKRGHLNVPVIGVAKAGWSLDQLRARARDSLEKHGGVDRAGFRQAVRACCTTSMATTTTRQRFRALRKELGSGPAAGALSRHPAGALWRRRGTTRQVGLRLRAPGSLSRSLLEQIWLRRGA